MTKENGQLVEELNQAIEESERLTNDIINHLDVVLEKLDTVKDNKDADAIIDGIKNNIFITLESMQAQDATRQRIERVINILDPDNTKFAASAKHLRGDKNNDVVDEDELAALIATMGN
jgi:hypothetical protein